VHKRRAVEIAAVLAVYLLFLAVGLSSGQSTMTIAIVKPAHGAEFHSSPVQLMVRVTVRGAPLPDVKARFTIHYGPAGDVSSEAATDVDGLARILVPAASGNYTWYVTARKEGYPTIFSRENSFSIRLSLVVDALNPSARVLAVSPVSFRAKVTDGDGHPVQTANVTFYVDSSTAGSNVTDSYGTARLTAPVATGPHLWFASATKDNEGGISGPVAFMVAEPGTFATENSSSTSVMLEIPQLDEGCESTVCEFTMWTRPRSEAQAPSMSSPGASGTDS